MKKKTYRCTRCDELLNSKRMVWLELDQRFQVPGGGAAYTDQYDIPGSYSQGGFVFGAACARIARKEYDNAKDVLKIPQFTPKDFERLDAALRLRVEACEENSDFGDEKREAEAWRKLIDKVRKLEMAQS